MVALNIMALTPDERLALIGELWNSLAPEDALLSPDQEAELRARMATFDRDIGRAERWDNVEAVIFRHV